MIMPPREYPSALWSVAPAIKPTGMQGGSECNATPAIRTPAQVADKNKGAEYDKESEQG